MWISQKMNNQVATNADGEQDAEAAKEKLEAAGAAVTLK